MRDRVVAGVAGLMVAAAGGAHAQGQRMQSDSARLQGTWVMVLGAADGAVMPPETAKTMKRVADGSYVTITMNGNLFFKAHFVLKPAASPKEIDYHMMEGPTKGATQLGIYKFSGDTLWFSFGAAGAARATEFRSTDGDKRTVSAWVRSKP